MCLSAHMGGMQPRASQHCRAAAGQLPSRSTHQHTPAHPLPRHPVRQAGRHPGSPTPKHCLATPDTAAPSPSNPAHSPASHPMRPNTRSTQRVAITIAKASYYLLLTAYCLLLTIAKAPMPSITTRCDAQESESTSPLSPRKTLPWNWSSPE